MGPSLCEEGMSRPYLTEVEIHWKGGAVVNQPDQISPFSLFLRHGDMNGCLLVKGI